MGLDKGKAKSPQSSSKNLPWLNSGLAGIVLISAGPASLRWLEQQKQRYHALASRPKESNSPSHLQAGVPSKSCQVASGPALLSFCFCFSVWTRLPADLEAQNVQPVQMPVIFEKDLLVDYEKLEFTSLRSVSGLGNNRWKIEDRTITHQ